MQPGDVKRTFADIEHSKQKLNYTPTTKIVEGIPRFIDWFKKYNKWVKNGKSFWGELNLINNVLKKYKGQYR